ncbi:hypothetical protein Acr_05g0003880 [Actinidia rufa]|uniref:Ankyrin repeat family protein n=1 Tax=Actinidia rufa TaxID=165716 RepID=A0A7J0ELE1_9ERIC|nr:hypothetical protein Acr_05g0003880 [Actinidia rufa]
MASQARREDSLGKFDMQLIGNFLSFASRGDRVGLNRMLREGIFPDVQDYDKRTALHLTASEGYASIVELLLQYKAHVNLKDRWLRTDLDDILAKKVRLDLPTALRYALDIASLSYCLLLPFPILDSVSDASSSVVNITNRGLLPFLELATSVADVVKDKVAWKLEVSFILIMRDLFPL